MLPCAVPGTQQLSGPPLAAALSGMHCLTLDDHRALSLLTLLTLPGPPLWRPQPLCLAGAAHARGRAPGTMGRASANKSTRQACLTPF